MCICVSLYMLHIYVYIYVTYVCVYICYICIYVTINKKEPMSLRESKCMGEVGGRKGIRGNDIIILEFQKLKIMKRKWNGRLLYVLTT